MPPPTANVDAAALERALQRELRGEVLFDGASRALYATDASNYRQVPIGVVRPRDAEDVVAAVALAREHRAPLLSRGGGTSLAGQCCNVALVLDFSRHMNAVLEIDAGARRARVQPGVVLDALRDAAAPHGLTFGPDPATHSRCTLGGMIGNNSCGVHSILAGRTVDNVHALDVLTSDGVRLDVGPTPPDRLAALTARKGRVGEIYRGLDALRRDHAEAIRARFPDLPRRVSGFNLDELLDERGFQVARALVGTEGTCVTTLEADLHLVPRPAARALVLLAYPDAFTAADDVPAILRNGAAHGPIGHSAGLGADRPPDLPIGLEGFDERLVDGMRRCGLHLRELESLPEGGCWLLVEYGGADRDEAATRARRLVDALDTARATDARVLVDAATQTRVWALRESGLGATAHVPGRRVAWEGWEDAAVAPERLGAYLREFDALMTRFDYSSAMYGHFGDGCVHFRIDFDLETATGIAHMRAFVEEAADLVVRHGGTLSGEHGEGQARAELLPRMFGDDLVGAFAAFKRLWDPDGLMNPGKVVDPHPLDTNLRLGADFRPASPPTALAWDADDGSLGRSLLRCVGVGACRKLSGGTMCPSYRATREERHSTRGRAHLLYEMLHSDLISDGFASDDVAEALDLCLGCKACRTECPTGVDVASYKAEFLARHHEHAARPLRARMFASLPRWGRWAARMPRLANALLGAPGLARLGRRALGIVDDVELPRFAHGEARARWDAMRRAGRGDVGAAAASPGGAPTRAASSAVTAPDAPAPADTAHDRVILWPDTFTTLFAPRVALAAVELLRAARFDVAIPSRPACCGRPLYDVGDLDRARAWFGETLDALGPWLDEPSPIVVLEPGCLSVFLDEGPRLLPRDPRAAKLQGRVRTLASVLRPRADAMPWRDEPGRALLHGHCHQKALLGLDDDVALLHAAGLACDVPDTGCCGMAGAFGLDAAHADVSRAIGEVVLLPSVRAADSDVAVLTDGFSCREQVRHHTPRRARHVAEFLAERLSGGVES